MKIGVVTASYPRVDGDHAGSFVAAHVGALRTAGHEVDVIGAHTIASDLFYRGGAPDALERGGLRTYLAAARFSAQLTASVARRAGDWDLIIAHWLAPSALAAVFGTLPRTIPILAIAHGGDIHTLRRLNLLAPTLYALRARGVRLAFVSHELRDLARDAAPRLARWLDAALVQPMGIDVAHFAALRSAPAAAAPPGDVPRVLVVARLVPVKGVDVAIRAMDLVRTRARLVIAGDGPERARLESMRTEATGSAASSAHPSASADSMASTHSSAPSMTLVGAVDRAALDQLLREADCVVIPSRVLPNGRTEGTPVIALEALASGVPVIASAVGGLRELAGITHVRPDDPVALARAIDRVLATPTSVVDASIDASSHDWSVVSDRLIRHARVRTPRHEQTPQCVSRFAGRSDLCLDGGV